MKRKDFEKYGEFTGSGEISDYIFGFHGSNRGTERCDSDRGEYGAEYCVVLPGRNHRKFTSGAGDLFVCKKGAVMGKRQKRNRRFLYLVSGKRRARW